METLQNTPTTRGISKIKKTYFKNRFNSVVASKKICDVIQEISVGDVKNKRIDRDPDEMNKSFTSIEHTLNQISTYTNV